MRNKFLALILIIIFFQSALFSQNKYDLSQFGSESFRFIKQPLKWENNDWLKLGLFSAGTILLMQADLPIHDAVLKDQSYYKSFPIEAGRIWGEVYPTAIIAGAFGLHGLIANDPSTKKIGFEIVQTALYAGAITTFLKIATGRARPFTDRGSAAYHPFTFFDDDFHSLPSGHVTLAFSLSTVLSKNTKSDLLEIIAYLPAVLTAISRVYQDNHWSSDVFLSAAIGYFVGDWVVNLHEEKRSSIETISISPLAIRIAIF
jgi:membrane-associated phospholipid phosphatase